MHDCKLHPSVLDCPCTTPLLDDSTNANIMDFMILLIFISFPCFLLVITCFEIKSRNRRKGKQYIYICDYFLSTKKDLGQTSRDSKKRKVRLRSSPSYAYSTSEWYSFKMSIAMSRMAGSSISMMPPLGPSSRCMPQLDPSL